MTLKVASDRKECDICKLQYRKSGNLYFHTAEACLTAQVQEIPKLKADLAFWKDAWHSQREFTGKAAWEVPNPFYLSPAKQEQFKRYYETFVEFMSRKI